MLHDTLGSRPRKSHLAFGSPAWLVSLTVMLGAAQPACGPDASTLKAPPHVSALVSTGVAHYERGAYDLALNAFEQALAILNETLGETHPDVATTLHHLGLLHKRRGDYERALPMLQRSLEIRARVLGEADRDIALSLNGLAELYQERGDYERASTLYQQALDILDRQPGKPAPILSTTLTNLATLYQIQGDYERALPLHVRALEIMKATLGAGHHELARAMNRLAALHQIRGEYAQAFPLYQQALAIVERRFGERHPLTAETLNAMARWFRDQGEHERAAALHRRALAIRRKMLGDDHPDVAASLNDLAELHLVRGELEPGLSLYQQAMDILEKRLGTDHPLAALTLTSMALVHQAQGRYDQALTMHLRALEIRRKALGDNHADVAHSLNNLGKLYHLRQEYGRAALLLQQALGVARGAFGDHHPLIGQISRDLATLHWDMGKRPKALEYLRQGLQVTERTLKVLVFASSEDQKHARFAAHRPDTSLAVALHLQAPGDPGAAQLALETVLRHKAFVLDATASELRYLRRQASNEVDRALLDEIAHARSRLSNLLLRGPDENVAAYKAQTEALWQRIDALEAVASRRSSAYRAASKPVTVADVQKRLEAHTALVEIVMYRWFDRNAAPGPAQWSTTRYAAYVLTAHAPPQAVDLGESAAIDEAVQRLRSALMLHRSNAWEVARALDARLMQPVRALLGDVRAIYVSPDGALNLVPFEALLDENGRYLSERFSFTYLNSGRELVQRVPREPTGQTVVVVANPAFERRPPAVASGAPDLRRRRSRGMDGRTFLPLPGTAREAAVLRRLFPTATVLTGVAASEEALKSVQAPHILHVATHGFFLPDQEIGPPPERTFWSKDKGALLTTKGSRIETPLVRSGLALAGANRLQSGDEDGFLTALELSSMDLDGTRLVVLSACDTGVGTAKTGEGVFGLRRALVMAGAETQVVSLWKVDDETTADLMAAYYERLLAGKGRSEALHEVKRAFLRDPERAHPYYWAGFIVSGDPSPLPQQMTRAVAPVQRGARGCACDVALAEQQPVWHGSVILGILVLGLLTLMRRRIRSR